jgi:hypothetical protein
MTLLRNILDSAGVYAARTVGVLGFMFFLWARAALAERLRVAFAR